MKKTIKVSGSKSGFKAVVSRKKRKGDVLAKSIDNKRINLVSMGNGNVWCSQLLMMHLPRNSVGLVLIISDITESESIDMEEECLVKKTSIDYNKSGAFTEENLNQMLKSLCVKTKKMLGKSLGVIDYDTVSTNDDMLDDSFLLPPPLPIKPTVQIPVCKSFALDIDLVAIAGKFSQEKLSFIRKIFSSVNGFGGASTPSKFGGIIHVTFTSEKAMMAAKKLANDHGVVVNTNLKCSAVRTVVSEFGLIKLIKMQLADLLASKWSILIGKNAICVARTDVDKQTWDFRNKFRDFIGSVGGKTCVIDYNPVSYACACCVTVCFGSESDLVSAMAATPVIKRIGLCWSRLSLALCSVCSLLGHIFLNCASVKVGLTLKGRKASFSAQNQVRLATIYVQKSTPISRLLVFSDKTWTLVVGAPLVYNSHGTGLLISSNNVDKPLLSVVNDLEKCLVCIESSLLELFVSAVFQPSSGCQLPVTPPSQNQGEDIVMRIGSGNATSDKTAAVRGSTVSSEVVKLKNMLEGLSALVMSLSARLDGLALASGALPLPLS
ncbi:hypothetical protein G9A89_004436 [Geosiphon pyriformis]|nr:hypothetical protein G9A89_004436 [Geosiphon pyriformis]